MATRIEGSPAPRPQTTSAPAPAAAEKAEKAEPAARPASNDLLADKSGSGFGLPKLPSPGDIWGGIKDAFGQVKDAVSGVIQGGKELVGQVTDAVNKLVTEDVPAFARGIKDAVVQTLQTAGGQAAIDLLQGVGEVRKKLGIDPPGRSLTETEITELKKVFGDTIDYSKVRVNDNVKDGLTGANRAMTLGNEIYMPGDKVSDPSYMQTLVHEMGHIWQYQHGGPDYATKALQSQLFGDGEGWGQRGYDWEEGIAKGKSWAELSPEQQAHLIDEAYGAGWFNDESQKFVHNGTDYTDYLKSAVDQMRRGEGAP
jgi:hypothetical protein